MGRKITLLLLVLALVASACSGDDDEPADGPEVEPTVPTGGVSPGRAGLTAGPVTVRLSEGESTGPVTADPATVVEGTPLDASAIDGVLDRLPEWTGDEAEQVDFNRPAESLPPPVSGDTVDVPFPADGGDPPPDIDDGPLTVLRHQPEGEVGIAPFMSITFNQPMVALGTVEQSDQAEIPVAMTPELPGRWQWIGTRTLRFEHDPDVFDRLPMATSYTVVVPAGTTSAVGGVLEADHRFAFETPSPTVQQLWPGHESLPLEPIFYAEFDQRVDPDAVLAVTTLTLDGSAVDVRLASDDEIADDESVSSRVAQALEGTWLAFRPAAPLTADSEIRIDIGPDVPSTEGPNTTDEVFTEQARTYAPLRVEQQSCRPADDCQPEWGFSVSFNNELDPESIAPDDLVFEPELPGAWVRIQGQSIRIDGPIVGGTVYEMTVPGDLRDVFGQTLGADEVIEFHVDDAFPFLDFEQGLLVTLDPLVDSQTLPLQLRNHNEVRVRAFAVDPSDWPTFESYWEDRWSEDRLPTPPWTEIYDQVQPTGAPPNERFEARIDLEPVFGGEPGMAVVVIEGVGELANLNSQDDRHYWDNQPVVQWVQATSLGGDLLADDRTGYAWVTDLTTGAPVAGASVELIGAQGTAATDSDGLAEFALPGPDTDSGPLVVSLGDDVAITQARANVSTRDDQALWYVVDDRGLYRPGETISVKGWVRLLDLSDDATIEQFPEGEPFEYVVKDSFGIEVASGDIALNAAGGFDFTADLPLGANLGRAWIELRHPSTPLRFGHTHSFQIQEFRRPEFEVTARAETPGPYLVDDPATVAVDATYYSGGPLPDAPVDWRVVTRPTSYSPPGWDGFTFGVWTPWWERSSFDDFGGRGFGGPGFEPEESVETFSGTTDTAGTHFLRMDFDGDGEGRPTTVSATASVTDVNRQTWSSTTDLLVHAGELYIGLQATRPFVEAGDPLPVEVIVTDIDGAAVPGRVADVVAERVRTEYVDGEWTDVVLDAESCEVTSGDEPEVCTFAMAEGGRYRIAASVVDDAGRESRSEMTRWVSGGESLPSRQLELQEATVIPDKEEYEAGDTAEIFVGSPFGAAHGLMTVSRNGIEEIVPFEIEGGDTILEIDILDEHVPGLSVGVELVGVTDRAADDGTVLPDVAPRPAFATGGVELRVPPMSRTLSVEANPADDVVEPGASTSVTVRVTDADGNAVEDAELLVVAVDEAVLALTGYELLDPLEIFYRSIDSREAIFRGRESIRLADPQALLDLVEQLEGAVATTTTAFGGGDETTAPTDMALDDADSGERSADGFAAEGVGGDQAIEVRSNFDALALWDPEVATDADGRATVDFDLPDSLTRYRVMVVAVDGVDRFGSAESNLTARLPLQVRPSAPRFLNFGDDFELPVVVQNLTDDALDVDVVLQTANLEMNGPAGQSVTVPANDRVEVRFPVTTESAGTARFRAVAVSADHADAATVGLPVYTPATAEAFATYGVVDSGATIQPLLAPDGVIPQFGGLEVTTSSTAVQALTDAVLYLAEFEYTSADAYASRILAIAALRDVLEAFEAEGVPTPAEFDRIVADDIAELAALQNWDGGWSTWRRNTRTSPYRSVHVMHALYEAEANGYDVPDNVLAQGRSFIQRIEDFIPQDWSAESRDTLIAYSLFVRRIDGDVDSGKADRIWRNHGLDFGLDALAWLWPVIGDEAIATEIRRNFSNRVTETPSAATFTTDTSEDDYLLLRSDRRTDGIILDAMLLMDPGSDLIPKIVTGLIGNQRQGRWGNSQENAFILLALNNYFDTFEATTPDFVARVWLGDLYAAEHTFEGRSVDSQETVVPMQDVIDGGDTDLVLAKEGDGRLYYRLGLRYAPDDFELDPLDRGFVVERTYEAVDDEGDVWRDDDGVWHIAAGAEVRVNLTMVNDSRRTNMALLDPLPAGLEPSNPSLAVTADVPVEEAEAGWWFWTWYDHQNMRDDRVEAFASYLWAGTHEYSYVARATTPGTFVVPPTRAEEIYAPEVFGRSASALVIIE